jgi:hypothetical protein
MQESNNSFNGFDHLYPYQNDDIEFNAEILNTLLQPTQNSNDDIQQQTSSKRARTVDNQVVTEEIVQILLT